MNPESGATLVVLPADLIFAARIRAAAEQEGVEVSLARTVRQAGEMVGGDTRSLIVDLDTRSGDPVGLIERVKQSQPQVRVLAYVSHVREDTIAAAREAGADQVIARGAFAKRLPELLLEYS